MGILSNLFGSAPPEPRLREEPRLAVKDAGTGASIGSGAGWGGVGSLGAWASSGTGVPMTPLASLQSSTVYACVKCLAEDIAKLPVTIRRRLPLGGFELDHRHPLNRLLRKPNRWQTAIDFWRYVVTSLVLRGNGYAAVLRDGAGNPRSLVPLNPDRVSVMISPKGWLFYIVSHPLVGDGITIHQDDMLHLRGMSLDGGATGVSPITFAQDAVGLALATQRHGTKLFRNGAQIGGVLYTDQVLSKEAAERVAQSWSAAYSGVENAHKTAVLEQGLKFEKVTMTSEDAQFLETRKYTSIDICSLFRVPPHKVMNLDRATFSNIEDQGQSYIDDALMPIGVSAEQGMDDVLLFEDERATLSLAFEFDALLRGNMVARYTAHGIGIDKGFKTPDEARVQERMIPRGGAADQLRFALNSAPDAGVKPPAAVPVGTD